MCECELEELNVQEVSHMQFPVLVCPTPCCKQEPVESSHMDTSGHCGGFFRCSTCFKHVETFSGYLCVIGV